MQIEGIIFDRVSIAREVVFADSLIAVSHPTGHPEMALGAAIKNLGMGLSSRIGKLRQHSSVKPYVDAKACTLCRKCIQWCPVDAIVEKKEKAFILKEKCIGCGECLSVCNFDAIRYNWGVESADLQKRVAEHALGVILNKRGHCFFFNFLIGYLLLHREQTGYWSLAIYAAAMLLHIATSDFDQRQEHPDDYDAETRWVLAAGVFAGWLVGALDREVPPMVIGFLFAFLAGGVVLNTMKEELPEDRDSRFIPFGAGAAAYAVLLLLIR